MDIWGGPEMIEDKADAVMFAVKMLRRLASQCTPGTRKGYALMWAARSLEIELEEKG